MMLSGPAHALELLCVASWLVPTILKPRAVIIPTPNLKKKPKFTSLPRASPLLNFSFFRHLKIVLEVSTAAFLPLLDA